MQTEKPRFYGHNNQNAIKIFGYKHNILTVQCDLSKLTKFFRRNLWLSTGQRQNRKFPRQYTKNNKSTQKQSTRDHLRNSYINKAKFASQNTRQNR